ncbi:MAG: hypothetical protein KKI08_11390, partial [Armatimonadetes bacterium]|nr:hypothetical protein [Armatimonadota bacterium]
MDARYRIHSSPAAGHCNRPPAQPVAPEARGAFTLRRSDRCRLLEVQDRAVVPDDPAVARVVEEHGVKLRG